MIDHRPTQSWSVASEGLPNNYTVLGSTVVHCTSYVRMGQVQNGGLYWRYRSNSTIMKAECCKAFTHKTHHYSIVESAPRLPLTFLKVERIVCKVSILFFLSFFSSHTTQKLKGVYEHSTYATNALLSEIFLFWFRATYVLWLASYSPKHASRSSLDTPFCVHFKYNTKTTDGLQLYYTANGSFTTKDALFHVKSSKAVGSYKLWPRTNITVLLFLCASMNDNNIQGTYDYVIIQ